MTAVERFWAKVDATGDCWEWTGHRNEKGYGRVRMPDRHWRVHRLAWFLLVGAIPDGLQLDHLCRNRACVNPDHLEPVTNRENTLRGISPQVTRARATSRRASDPSCPPVAASDARRGAYRATRAA